jgi:hypothetical protein
MNAMESRNEEALRQTIVMGVGLDSSTLREPGPDDLKMLLDESFERGRILDQRKREGKTRDFDYLVYRVVIPEKKMSERRRYLWEYAWTN